MNTHLNSRRKFLTTVAQGVGLSALGGLVWSAYLQEAKATGFLLRPPGAAKEEDFLKLCIKCGQCVVGCPFETLSLAQTGSGLPVGTPVFTPRETPCYMCVDIPCVPVCPTGALDMKSVSSFEDGQEVPDISKARMGLAVVDGESCIAYWGIQCDACYRVCPIIDSAITLEHRRNERTGKHAFLIPVVNSDTCTGCGLCEKACVTEEPAIFIRPHSLVQGKVGSHYVRGWDTKDEQRIDEARSTTTTTEVSKKSALDSLNEGGLY